MFGCLKTETVLRVIKYLLLEERVIVIGERRADIFNCCEGLQALMFPFRYNSGVAKYVSYIGLREPELADFVLPALMGLDK